MKDLTEQFNEVFDLIHQAAKIALEAEALAKESTLVAARVRRTFNRRELIGRIDGSKVNRNSL